MAMHQEHGPSKVRLLLKAIVVEPVDAATSPIQYPPILQREQTCGLKGVTSRHGFGLRPDEVPHHPPHPLRKVRLQVGMDLTTGLSDDGVGKPKVVPVLRDTWSTGHANAIFKFARRRIGL
jgi:hypothetical protein